MVRKANSLSIYLDILQYLENDDFNEYWEGFKKAPFALYNDKEVILCNHPNPPKDFQDKGDHFSGPISDIFVGNRSMNLNGYYTVIWNIHTLEPNITIDIDVLYSKLIHKMFHCYQKSLGEKRWADEKQFIDYNFSVESLALRLMDKDFLVCALGDPNNYTRDKLLSDFINRRQLRRDIIGNKLTYEFALESTEGPACYVEYKSLAKLKKVSLNDFVIDRLKDFSFDDLSRYRQSCHDFGVFMCIILDNICPGWYDSYMKSNIYLFKFLRSKAGFTNELLDMAIDPFYISSAKEIIDDFNKSLKESFITFKNNPGYRTILRGDMHLDDFDPLNILALNNEVLHKGYIECGNITVNGTSLVVYDDDFYKIKSIEFVTLSEPTVFDHCINTERGKFYGNILLENGCYIVDLYSTTNNSEI